MIQAFSATYSCCRLFRLYAFFLVCPQLSCCNPTLVLQALPTNRQLLEIEALLCCNPAFGLQALPTSRLIPAQDRSLSVAIPHSGCRLFRHCDGYPYRIASQGCNPAFGLQALPTHRYRLGWRSLHLVAIPHSGCRLFRQNGHYDKIKATHYSGTFISSHIPWNSPWITNDLVPFSLGCETLETGKLPGVCPISKEKRMRPFQSTTDPQR